MLTADQIARAQFWVHAHADPEIGADLLARGAVDGVIAAYGRVVALYARWETTTARDGGGWEWTAASLLRRALEG
jgi:hypothetical protein